MTLNNVKEYLKSNIDCANWYVGKIDANKEYCIGVYSTESPEPFIALGGLNNTSYATKAISILVHWGKGSALAEEKAQEVYNLLFGRDAVINNKQVIKFDMKSAEPIVVGTDEKGIFEYVINTVIYYNKKG